MKSISWMLLCVGTVLVFSACETTGDPNRGGIFWSEEKAKVRLDERRATLNSVESDTARVQRKNAQLESAAARKRAALDQ